MRNKRASLSTLLFVLMVFLVCFTTFYSFAKHKDITDRQMVDVSSVIKSNFQDDVVYLQLKIFSEESIFYAYTQLISEYNFKLTDSGGENVFDYSKLQNGSAVSELDYKAIFESLVQRRYNFLVSSYPRYTSADEEVFLALKNAHFSFDGEEISVQTSISVYDGDNVGLKVAYGKLVSYNSSLDMFGLADLRKISSVRDSCPYSSDIKLREECVLSWFPGFKFVEDSPGFRVISSDSGSFYLVKLISKEGYFIGPVNSGEKVVYPSISFLLPMKEEDKSKLLNLFDLSS